MGNINFNSLIVDENMIVGVRMKEKRVNKPILGFFETRHKKTKVCWPNFIDLLEVDPEIPNLKEAPNYRHELTGYLNGKIVTLDGKICYIKKKDLRTYMITLKNICIKGQFLEMDHINVFVSAAWYKSNPLCEIGKYYRFSGTMGEYRTKNDEKNIGMNAMKGKFSPHHEIYEELEKQAV